MAKSLGATVKNSSEFTSDAAIEGLGSAQFFGDVFTQPVGAVVGPVNVAGRPLSPRARRRFRRICRSSHLSARRS